MATTTMPTMVGRRRATTTFSMSSSSSSGSSSGKRHTNSGMSWKSMTLFLSLFVSVASALLFVPSSDVKSSSSSFQSSISISKWKKSRAPSLCASRRTRTSVRTVQSRPLTLLKESLEQTRSSTSISTTVNNNSNNNNNNNKDDDRVSGLLVLASVPFAWGTYGPVVKYLYQVVEPKVPGIVFSAAYYIVASIVLNTLLAVSVLQQKQELKSHEGMTSDDGTILDDNDSDASLVMDGSVQTTATTTTTTTQPDASSARWGGIELGLYLFIANALQVKGLETVPSDRAGFLIQLTTIMVPLMQAVAAAFTAAATITTTTTTTTAATAHQSKTDILGVSKQTWTACVLAFFGVIVMGMDGSTGSTSAVVQDGDQQHNMMMSMFHPSFSLFSQGDLLIVAAAVLYSLHVVRLSKYAQQSSALALAASKATTESILSILVVSALYLWSSGSSPLTLGDGSGTDTGVSEYFHALTTGIDSGSITFSTMQPAFGAVLWTGFITCAYTIFAQSYGQARVGPSEANLLYTIQPLFTAVFGYFLLGETLGTMGVVGAAFIASAVYIVASSSSSIAEENDNIAEDGMDDLKGKTDSGLINESLQQDEVAALLDSFER